MTKSNKKREQLRQQQAQKAAQKPTIPFPPTIIPPRSKVFDTFELVELILLHFSSDIPFLLTTLQRVCKTFHSIIASSPLLQQALFFQPIPSTPSPSDPPLSNPRRQFNPILYKSFPHLFPYDPANPPTSHTYDPDGYPPTPAREGIVSSKFRVLCVTWTSRASLGVHLPPIADFSDSCKRHYAFTRKGATWRRMLVSQPPPVRVARIGDFPNRQVRKSQSIGSQDIVTVNCRIRPSILEDVPRRMVEVKGGLRMGDLLDGLWTVEWGREYPWMEPETWCAWRMPEEMRRELWKYQDKEHWDRYYHSLFDPERYRMPETELSRWADGADFAIGGFVPKATRYPNEVCKQCMGAEGKVTKRCMGHSQHQRMYKCRDYQPRGPLSLNPRW